MTQVLTGLGSQVPNDHCTLVGSAGVSFKKVKNSQVGLLS